MAYNISFGVDSSWNSGFTGNMVLTNANPTALNGWTVEFDAPFQITNLWNGQIVSHTGNHYVVKNAPYNSAVAANGSVSFGFQASSSGTVPQPTGYAVNGQAVGGTTPPSLPTITVGDISLMEGQSGTTNAIFTVSLSKTATETVTVTYQTADGTAKAGTDYATRSGTLTFAPGDSTKQVMIPVTGDTAVEQDETFFLNLSSPTKATLGDSQGIATIRNDETAPTARTLSIADVGLTEGQSGTKNFEFTVSLSSAATSAVSVKYATANGTATAGSDYTANSGTVSFAAGETTKTVLVAVTGDTVSEVDETFTINLSGATGATIARAQATGTIRNDDAVPTAPTLSVADIPSLTEGNPVTVPGSPGGVGTGFFHTRGNQILDAANNVVKIAGVNWFGMESGRYAPDGLHTRNYKEMMHQMADLGFNTIRLPFSDQLFASGSTPNGIDYGRNADLAGLNGLQIMDKVVAYAGEIGLKIILDHHRSAAGAGANGSGLWFEGAFTEQTWINNWKMLATRYANTPTVIGADLHNEPHGPATWGGGGSNDWAAAAERAGNAVLASNPNWLIFVEGIEAYQNNYYWWGGNLMGVKDRPVQLAVANKLVYSTHDYPNSIYGQPWFNDPSFPNNLPAKFDQMWGYIYKQNIAPVYLGEFGSRLSDPKDVAWLSKIKSYLNGDFDANGTIDIPAGQQGIDWTWWSWNPNSGDTGGILADDWNTPIQNKVTQLQPLMFDFESGSPGSTTNSVTNAVFTVSLSAATTQSVTVAYKSAPGTADASDFTPVSGTLTFAPGERTKTVTVKVAGDGQLEANETFQLQLSSPNGATLLKGTATATIVNDDASTLAAAVAAPTPAGTSTLAAKPGAQIAATTVVTSDWGTGFSANVAVKNTGTEAVDAWTLQLKSPVSIANIWNAQIESRDGDTYLLHNAGWNSVIVPGQEIVFGFEASGRPSGTFEWVM